MAGWLLSPPPLAEPEPALPESDVAGWLLSPPPLAEPEPALPESEVAGWLLLPPPVVVPPVLSDPDVAGWLPPPVDVPPVFPPGATVPVPPLPDGWLVEPPPVLVDGVPVPVPPWLGTEVPPPLVVPPVLLFTGGVVVPVSVVPVPPPVVVLGLLGCVVVPPVVDPWSTLGVGLTTTPLVLLLTVGVTVLPALLAWFSLPLATCLISPLLPCSDGVVPKLSANSVLLSAAAISFFNAFPEAPPVASPLIKLSTIPDIPLLLSLDEEPLPLLSDLLSANKLFKESVSAFVSFFESPPSLFDDFFSESVDNPNFKRGLCCSLLPREFCESVVTELLWSITYTTPTPAAARPTPAVPYIIRFLRRLFSAAVNGFLGFLLGRFDELNVLFLNFVPCPCFGLWTFTFPAGRLGLELWVVGLLVGCTSSLLSSWYTLSLLLIVMTPFS